MTLRHFWFCLAIPWFGRVDLATEYGRNLTEKLWEEIIMNREPNRFQFPIDKSKTELTVDCDVKHFVWFCVSESSYCILVYTQTYVYERLIRQEFS